MADLTKNVIFFVKNCELTCLCHVKKKNKNFSHFFCLLFFFPTSKNFDKNRKNSKCSTSEFENDSRSILDLCLPKIPTAGIPLYKSDEKSRSSKTLNFEILFLKFFSSKIFRWCWWRARASFWKIEKSDIYQAGRGARRTFRERVP